MKLSFELKLSEGEHAIFGFEHDGAFITDPYLCDAGMMPVDPADEYGITKEEADHVVMLNSALESATEDAVNAACLNIQQALGVTAGDFAGRYFSGDVQKDQIRTVLASYMQAEMKDAENSAN